MAGCLREKANMGILRKVIDGLGEAISRRTDTRVLADMEGEIADKKRIQVIARGKRRAMEPSFMSTSDGKMKMIPPKMKY